MPNTLEVVTRLAALCPAIAPSLLLCDFGNLEREVQRLEAAGVQVLHLDVMDGQFVPNLSYGLPIVEALRRLTRLPLDVHLMISEPQRYVDAFVSAGADVLTIHVEATQQPREVLQQIRRSNIAAGIALNPDTPLTAIEDCLDVCDMVLVMSVPAGFGGQKFHPVALDKLRELRSRLPQSVLLEVDGGVNEDTITACVQAGADLLVVGSAIFKHPDYQAQMQHLTQLMPSAPG